MQLLGRAGAACMGNGGRGVEVEFGTRECGGGRGGARVAGGAAGGALNERM
jgi:hypothetical protein